MNQTESFITDEQSDISIDSIVKDTQALVWNVSCGMEIPTVPEYRPN